MLGFIIWFLLLPVRQCFETCTELDQYCSCDEKCSLYGDCCPGHVHFNKTAILHNVLTCKETGTYSKVWIIDKCVDDSHKFAKYCLKKEFYRKNKLKSLIPVVTMGGEIYENLFCAQCNGKIQFQYLNTSVKCSDVSPTSFKEVNEFINNGDSCYVETIFPASVSRNCYRNLVRKCPLTYDTNFNQTILEYCENKAFKTVSVVSDGLEHYRNEYCCSCWNKTCYSPFFGDISRSFSYLLNFNEWDKDDTIVSTVSGVLSNDTLATKVDSAIFYVSYVLTIVSIISLIILIVIYGSQRIFHTFGGYLTICLSACLLLMNLLTLLLTNETLSKSRACLYIGILQHFIALSNFIWMSIYALDLVQTFGFRSIRLGKKKTFKTFLLYCALGFGIAAIFVGGATICEFKLSRNSTIRPKYGGDNCWFTSKFGGIFWYFAPICILLTWNLVACVVVFYKLSKTAKECRVVQQTESNNTLWLCVRLTAVFGIGYLFQIIAVVSGVKALIVIGTLINCLQGCLLSLCFAWTKKVRDVVTSTVFSTASSGNTKTQTQTQSGITTIHIAKDNKNAKLHQ